MSLDNWLAAFCSMYMWSILPNFTCIAKCSIDLKILSMKFSIYWNAPNLLKTIYPFLLEIQNPLSVTIDEILNFLYKFWRNDIVLSSILILNLQPQRSTKQSLFLADFFEASISLLKSLWYLFSNLFRQVPRETLFD